MSSTTAGTCSTRRLSFSNDGKYVPGWTLGICRSIVPSDSDSTKLESLRYWRASHGYKKTPSFRANAVPSGEAARRSRASLRRSYIQRLREPAHAHPCAEHTGGGFPVGPGCGLLRNGR
jgi:hypothetical protein